MCAHNVRINFIHAFVPKATPCKLSTTVLHIFIVNNKDVIKSSVDRSVIAMYVKLWLDCTITNYLFPHCLFVIHTSFILNMKYAVELIAQLATQHAFSNVARAFSYYTQCTLF